MAANLSTNSFQKTYLESCINLIKTLTIKSELAANLINVKLLETVAGYVIPDDKTKWKYYLNVSGEYHDTDTPMYVTSLDTLENIVFNKRNLSIHTATAAAYQYGSRYYYLLVDKYPELETLITGILNPCRIEDAVTSKDGSILAYDSRYIEPQEQTLLAELQEYIYKQKIRWSVPSYRTSDTLYPAAEHAVMCLNLVPILMNLRQKRTKTEEVHSFYIRQYLASHFKIDQHYEFLTLKQRLWLYRNITRISKNFGKNSQFDELMNILLTERSIPLAEYTVRHLDTFNSDLTPVTVARRVTLNEEINTTEQNYVDIPVLFDKNKDKIPGNDIELQDNGELMLDMLENSPSSVIATKMLESDMVDYTDAAPDRLHEVLIREFISTVCSGKYNAYTEIKDPRTGDYYTLSVKDALTYMVYLAYNRSGIAMEYIPPVMSYKYLLDPYPTVQELMSVADSSFRNRQKLAEYLINAFPRPTLIRSVSSFYERGYRIYEACLKGWHILSNTDDIYERGEAEKMYMRMFGYQEMTIYKTPLLVSDWLARTNIQPYDFEPNEAEDLIVSIFSSATGLTLDNSTSVPFIQKSLVSLMEKLTSYSVQYIANINEDPIVLLNRIAVRHSVPHSESFNTVHENPLVDVIEARGSVKEYKDLGNQLQVSMQISQSMHSGVRAELDPVVDTTITLNHHTSFNSKPNLARVGVYSPTGELYGDDVPFIGYEIYKQLTQEQIKSVPNID